MKKLGPSENFSPHLVSEAGYRPDMMSYSRLHTKVLSKFFDTTCILRDAGAAVEQGSNKKAEGNANL